MTDEKQKRIILLTALLDLGGEATKAETLDHIARHKFMKINAVDDQIMDNRDELKWRNNIAFIRKHLVETGYLDGSVRGMWKTTSKSKAYLASLINELDTRVHYSRITPEVVRCARALIGA
jgi:hypothetical protein